MIVLQHIWIWDADYAYCIPSIQLIKVLEPRNANTTMIITIMIMDMNDIITER